MAFFEDQRLVIDDVSKRALTNQVLANPPKFRDLPVSNVLQLLCDQISNKAGKVGKTEGLVDLA